MISKPTSQKGPIAFSDLTLKHATFEVRSLPSYLHWDRAGTIWTEMVRHFPQLAVLQAEPTRTSFSIERKYILSVLQQSEADQTQTRIIVTGYFPQSTMKEFGDIAKIFLRVAEEHLEIREYTRVGLRLIFAKDFPSQQEAAAALLSTGLLKASPDSQFGIEGKLINPEYSIRREDEKKGAVIRLKSDTLIWGITPPTEWDGVEPVSIQKHRLSYDIDSYTIAPIAVEQFSPVDWILQVIHIVNRDSDKLFRGE